MRDEVKLLNELLIITQRIAVFEYKQDLELLKYEDDIEEQEEQYEKDLLDEKELHSIVSSLLKS